MAMFMCVSIVCLRAVSSGNAVMAALRCAAFEERSLKRRRGQHIDTTGSEKSTHSCCTSSMLLIPVDRVISAASDLYLYKRTSQSVLQTASPHAVITHLLSSVSISSATCGNGVPAFLDQKKSFASRS